MEVFLIGASEFIFHVLMCAAVCVGFHFLVHKKVDDKNHKHQEIDYDKLADIIISKVEKIELEKRSNLINQALSNADVNKFLKEDLK